MDTAEVEPADPWGNNRIVTLRTRLLSNLVVLKPLWFIAVGFALMFLSISFGMEAPRNDGIVEDLTIFGKVIFVLSLSIMIYSCFWGLINVFQMQRRYLRQVAYHTISSRPDRIVNPYDQGVIFVEIQSLQSGTRRSVKANSEIGFLQVYDANREICFEGDDQRMRIPVGAILTCHVEEVATPLQTLSPVLLLIEAIRGVEKHYFTMIRMRGETGVYDLAIAFRGDVGLFANEGRQRQANQLRNRVVDLAAH